jgi:hypothetical protein
MLNPPGDGDGEGVGVGETGKGVGVDGSSGGGGGVGETVTVTPSSDITATPATLTFTPTVFSGTVTVGSTATPGTTGTVKFSAPGYADGVVNVTVDQSTNLVVDPASLEIPANGAKPFTVKLANAPTEPLVTVTVKTSPMSNLTTSLASLTFTLGNFNINQTVLVSTGPGAVPGAQSVLLDAGPLGQFNLPVTITPTSNTTFFIDPANGNDTFSGTAAEPWRFVKNVLDVTQPTGLKVATVANAGDDVVVTILGGTNTENVPGTGTINTPALLAGSVTVLQAPSPKTFTLNLGGNKLTLKKGYKLQDIRIRSSLGSGAAVKITHPTAGLASVDVTCGAAATTPCVEVKGAGSHILKDVRVDVTDANANNIGILNNANLSIIGGRVRPTGNSKAITLIDSKGVLTVKGLTVDMPNVSSGTEHKQASKGIVLRAATSSVTDSIIYVANAASGNAIGINVQAMANPSTVVGNTFIGAGNSIGIQGGINLSPYPASPKNDFFGTFNGGQVQP